MSTFASNSRLTVLILAGLLIGSATAWLGYSPAFWKFIATSDAPPVRLAREAAYGLYLFDSGHSERALARIYYRNYQREWDRWKVGGAGRFNRSALRSRAIVGMAYLTGKTNKTAMREFVRGVTLTSKGKYDRATQNFERVFHADTPYLGNLALLYYGYCKQRTGDLLNAIDKYQMLERRAGDAYPELFYNMAEIYKQQGDHARADLYHSRYEAARGNDTTSQTGGT